MTRKWQLALSTAALVSLGAVGLALAHSGRTDSSGCHHNRRTGDYHCHGGGGGGGGGGSSRYRAPRVKPTRVQVTTIPRARVWIDGEYAGMSPTKMVKVEDAQVDIRIEHAALGSQTATLRATTGENERVIVRW